MTSIREIQESQRKERTTEMEMFLQDFLELAPAEQIEFLLIGLLYTVRDAEWCKKRLSE